MGKLFRLGNLMVNQGKTVNLGIRGNICIRGSLVDVGGRRMPKVNALLTPIQCEFRNIDAVTLDVSKDTLGNLQQIIACEERNKDGNIPMGAAGKPVYLLNGGIRYLSTRAGKPDHIMIPLDIIAGVELL